MISTVVTLKQLEALVWVADLGSFRAAAHHLNTTQPNISTRIAALEKTLGLSLMRRSAGPVELSDKGVEILASARATLRHAKHIVKIAERPDLITDRLRLGVTELVACTWLHSYLRAIKAAYPALNVELTVDLSHTLDRALAANQLDLAVQSAPFASNSKGALTLGQFPYVWVAAPKIAQALQGPQSVANLMPHSVLTHARHTQAFVQLEHHTKANAIPTAQLIASSSLAACVQMAVDGMGVSLLPEALVRAELANRSLHEIEVEWHPEPLSFAARYQSDADYVKTCAQLASACARDFAPR